MDQRVTWLLPVKNGMPFITETLASIANQSYSNWEVLAWDNGSDDGTVEELRRWIPSRLPGRVIVGEALPLGLSLARLVESAQTELCARIDADDVNEPDRLQSQVGFLQAHPGVSLVGSDVHYINEYGEATGEKSRLVVSDPEIRWTLRWSNPFNHPTVLFRRSVVLKAGNYHDRMPVEDYDLWFRVGLVTEMRNIPYPLVRYRQRVGSVTSGWNVAECLSANQTVGQRYSKDLFHSFSPSDALSLRSKVLPLTDEPIEFMDVLRLQRAASRTAIALGKPADYFRLTNLYRRQQRTLLRKYAKRNGLLYRSVKYLRQVSGG